MFSVIDCCNPVPFLLSVMNEGLIDRYRRHQGGPHPPPSPTSLLLTMGHLTKIVQRQTEHVIGANPRLINVLQDEALMESHDGVIICLDKAETQRLRRKISFCAALH